MVTAVVPSIVVMLVLMVETREAMLASIAEGDPPVYALMVEFKLTT